MSININLQKQITDMAKLDQSTRKKQWRDWQSLVKKFTNKNDPDYKKEIKKLSKELKTLDKKNTAKMQKIINKFGWPGKSLVGKSGAYRAWLLVQHADHDIIFQKKCLLLLKKAVKQNDADSKNIAFLTDRILVHQHKKQIYGTQLHGKTDGSFEPFPIKDLKNLDFRRKKMGLESFRVYIKNMEST